MQPKLKILRRVPIDFKDIYRQTGCTKGTLCKTVFGWGVRDGNGGVHFAIVEPPPLMDGEDIVIIDGKDWCFCGTETEDDMHDMTKAELVKLAARLAAENARLKAELADARAQLVTRLQSPAAFPGIREVWEVDDLCGLIYTVSQAPKWLIEVVGRNREGETMDSLTFSRTAASALAEAIRRATR